MNKNFPFNPSVGNKNLLKAYFVFGAMVGSVRAEERVGHIACCRGAQSQWEKE